MKKKRIFLILLILILVAVIGLFLYNRLNDDKTYVKHINEVNSPEGKDIEVNKEKSDDTEMKEYDFENQDGEKVKIEANKEVTATGFAGANNHVFYLQGNDLYYKNISTGVNELIATGVTDLYLNGADVTAELGKDGKILKENNYITYNK